jgi:hypothetical protein
MGFLEKRNPTASRASVIRSAIWGAVLMPLIIGFGAQPGSVPNRYWPVFVVATAILGAGVFAVCEWQLDDGDDQGKSDDALCPSEVWDRELDHECKNCGHDNDL